MWTLAILVSTLFVGSLAQILVLDETVVFAAKDATVFSREAFGKDGPSAVDLVLEKEKFFVAVKGSINGTSNVEATFQWSTQVNDEEPVSQGEFSLSLDGNGEFFLSTPLTDEGFLSVEERGGNFITATVTLVELDGVNDTQSDFKEARVYAVSAIESLLPLVTLVVLAVASRNVYVAMFFGIWLGSLLIEEGDIAASFKALFDDHLIPSITEELNFRTIMFTLFLAGFISMIKKSGGQDGFSNVIGKYATTARSTQLAAVFAGVGLFFDDYSSVLILGSSFKKLTDRFYVSREKLAFVADATAAPIASIAPISSWIAFELSRIAPELKEIRDSSAFETKDDLAAEYPFFLSTIPSRYYPIYMLVIQILLISLGVEFGPMLYAERKTRLQKRTDGGDGKMEIPPEQDSTNPADDTPRRAWNFFIPIGFFISTLLMSLVNIGVDNIESDNLELAPDEQKSLILREIFGATNSFEALVYTTMGSSLFALIFFLVQMKQGGKIVRPSLCLPEAESLRVKVVSIFITEN